MRILSVTWVIYDERIKEFCDNCTGAGLVIRNICEYIGKYEESYLFIGKYIMPEIHLDHVTIVNTQNESIDDSICYLEENEDHLLYMLSRFRETLDQLKPDIVNFHGIGVFMKKCIDICIERCQLYTFTEHLFIEPEHCISGYEKTVEWEIPVYNIPDIKIIAVSSGMKKKIMNSFPNIPERNINVILNGTNFDAEISDNNLKDKYHIKTEKILLCVGTLLIRKNQMQLISAFEQLPVEVKNNIKIIFCGKDRLNGELQRYIKEHCLQEKLFYAGAVSSEDMKKYYSIAHGLVMPSLAEGLSIAALESIAYGRPVIMFDDSECALDLNDKNVVCFAKNRNTDSLANAISEWNQKEWNAEYIQQYAKKFTMDCMTQNYLAYYKWLMDTSNYSR